MTDLTTKEELIATRKKLCECRRKRHELEGSLRTRTAKAVRELERHVDGLTSDVSAALSRQSKAERERDEARDEILRLKIDHAKKIVKMSGELKLSIDALHNVARTTGWGSA